MATLARLAASMFRRTNQRYGEPYMQAVRPIAEWDLPAYFAYDAHVDRIRGADGTILRNPEDYWATDTIYIVPTKHTSTDEVAEMLRVAAGGLLHGGVVDVYVEQADIAKVRAAHVILLDRQWYDVDNQQEAPSGYPGVDGLWTRVHLRGRSS